MRTTLDIDDDVLEAVKELAAREKKTAGAKLSELARLAILGPEREPTAGPRAATGFGEQEQAVIGGLGYWPTFPRAPGQPRRIITNAEIERIKEEIDQEEVEAANQIARGEQK
jgi:hypothetical protein